MRRLEPMPQLRAAWAWRWWYEQVQTARKAMQALSEKQAYVVEGQYVLGMHACQWQQQYMLLIDACLFAHASFIKNLRVEATCPSIKVCPPCISCSLLCKPKHVKSAFKRRLRFPLAYAEPAALGWSLGNGMMIGPSFPGSKAQAHM